MYPYTKESSGVRSGEEGGHVIGPSLITQLVTKNFFLQTSMRNSPSMSRCTTDITVCSQRRKGKKIFIWIEYK